jgi:hypothetical protein
MCENFNILSFLGCRLLVLVERCDSLLCLLAVFISWKILGFHKFYIFPKAVHSSLMFQICFQDQSACYHCIRFPKEYTLCEKYRVQASKICFEIRLIQLNRHCKVNLNYNSFRSNGPPLGCVLRSWRCGHRADQLRSQRQRGRFVRIRIVACKDTFLFYFLWREVFNRMHSSREHFSCKKVKSCSHNFHFV